MTDTLSQVEPDAASGASALEAVGWRRLVEQRFGAYARACLVGMMLAVPIVVEASDLMLAKLTVMWVLGVAAMALWVVRALQTGAWLPRSRLVWGAAAYLGVTAVATLASVDPAFSLLGGARRYGGLLPGVLYAAVMVLVLDLYRHRPHRLQEIAWASMAASTVVAIYVLVQAAGFDWLTWSEQGTRAVLDRPIGTLGNSNFVGAYLAISLPLTAYCAFSARHVVTRSSAFASCAIHCLGIWYSQSRGGMVALLVGAVVMAGLWWRRQVPRWALKLTALAVVGLVILSILALWHPGMDRAPGPLSRIARSNTLVYRSYYWESAVRIAFDHPALGTGPDTFYAVYPAYRNQAEAVLNPDEQVDKPHNIFLERATDIGFLGLGAYVFLFGSALVYGARKLRRSDGPRRLLLAAFMGSLVVYLVQGFFSIDVPPLALLGWTALGAVGCLADPAAGELGPTRRRPKHRRPPPWSVLAAIGLVALGVIVLGTLPLGAEVAARDGNLDAAARLNPLESRFPARSGALASTLAKSVEDPVDRLRHFRKAHAQYMEALERQPSQIFYVRSLALLNSTWAQVLDPARFSVAEQWWRRTVALSPNDPALRQEYRVAVGEMRATAGKLRQLALARPGDAGGWLKAAEAYAVVGDRPAALDAAGRVLALDPGNPRALEIRDLAAP